jgi:hypothetical protein
LEEKKGNCGHSDPLDPSAEDDTAAIVLPGRAELRPHKRLNATATQAPHEVLLANRGSEHNGQGRVSGGGISAGADHVPGLVHHLLHLTYLLGAEERGWRMSWSNNHDAYGIWFRRRPYSTLDQEIQSEILGKLTEQLLSPNLIHFLAPTIEVHDI